MAEDVAKRVIEIVAEKLDRPVDSIKPETRFVDDLQVDSLERAEILMEFEDEWELDIMQGENDEGINTVGEAIEYVKRELEKKSAKAT